MFIDFAFAIIKTSCSNRLHPYLREFSILMPFDTISHIYTTLIIVKVNALRVNYTFSLISIYMYTEYPVYRRPLRNSFVSIEEHEHARPVWKHSGVK